MCTTRLAVFAVLLLSICQPARVAAQIYADVTVGGAVNGTFTITLEHVKTPATVANFIGLATGRKGWLDLNTGAIRYDGFFNGVRFHRVIKDFVSQAGSRNGLGTDGPGYKFRDEIDPTLSHVAYAVAMANSGKNTNGSQFYICDGAQTSLDGNYAIFGLVTAGQTICDQINDTPVSGSTPLTPITIQGVSVYGPSLSAFNLNQPLLPNLLNANPILKKTGAVFTLEYESLPYSDYSVYHGSNLSTWAMYASGYAGSTAFLPNVDVTSVSGGTQHFFRLARADYSACATADVAGNTFRILNTSPSGASQFNGTASLNATKTAGTYTFDAGGTFAITLASFNTVQPYSATLYFRLSDGRQFQFNLQYNAAGGGAHAGATSVSGFSNIFGSFTVAP